MRKVRNITPYSTLKRMPNRALTVRRKFLRSCSPRFNLFLFFLMIRPPPTSTLFPYPTLFRSPPLPLALSPDDIETHEHYFTEPWQLALVLGSGPDGEPVSGFFRAGADEAWATTKKPADGLDRKSTRLNSSHLVISYAVFCLKK